MKSIKFVLICTFLFSLLSLNSIACDSHGNTGLVEENDLWIGVEEKSFTGMNQAVFNKVLDRIQDLYGKVFRRKGKTLKIVRNWSNGTVNAYAQQRGNTWMISMFGGLARHQTITPDGFAMVACHEIGHHVGGYPKKSRGWWGGLSWATNEGQADYWGAMKCMRKYFAKDNNVQVVRSMEIDSFATKKCQEVFRRAEDIAICQRTAMAGLSLGNLFKALKKLTTGLRFDSPDEKEVYRTSHKHPAPQCRLDTYFQGSLCKKSARSEVSDRDFRKGVCTRVDNFRDGVRPRCWFKPPRA